RKARPRSLRARGRSWRASTGRADGRGGAAGSDAAAASNRTTAGVIPSTSEAFVAGARPVPAERRAHVHSRRVVSFQGVRRLVPETPICPIPKIDKDFRDTPNDSRKVGLFWGGVGVSRPEPIPDAQAGAMHTALRGH